MADVHFDGFCAVLPAEMVGCRQSPFGHEVEGGGDGAPDLGHPVAGQLQLPGRGTVTQRPALGTRATSGIADHGELYERFMSKPGLGHSAGLHRLFFASFACFASSPAPPAGKASLPGFGRDETNPSAAGNNRSERHRLLGPVRNGRPCRRKELWQLWARGLSWLW